MGEIKNGAGQKKVDVIMAKVDKLLQQTSAVETRIASVVREVNARSADKDAIIDKLAEENRDMKQEIAYLSTQIESIYTGTAKLINALSAKLDAVKQAIEAQQAPEIDTDELSSRVAEKIIVPAAEVDYDVVAEKVSEKLSVIAPEIDYDTLGAKVVQNMYIPNAVVEDIDYDAFAEKLAEKLPSVAPEIDYDTLGTKVVQNMYIPNAVVEDIDYDAFAEKLAEKLPSVAPEIDYDTLGTKVVQNMYIPNAVVEDIDYDAFAEKLAEKLPSVAPEIDYDTLGTKVVQNMYIPNAVVENIDYDAVAEKLAAAIPAQEVVSADYIASKVAEQIVFPETTACELPDVDELAARIAEKVVVPVCEPEQVTVDEDAIACAVAEKIKASAEENIEKEEPEYEEVVTAEIDEQSLAEAIASKLKDALKDELVSVAEAVEQEVEETEVCEESETVEEPVAAPVATVAALSAIDTEEIADCVAKKVGTIAPEQFDVMVDDDGCDSLAKAIGEKLDYEAISALIAEKLAPVLVNAGEDLDTEELAASLTEKISATVKVDEDALAEKAASVLSNYLPEIDTDEIAEKVVAGVVPSLPAAPEIDYVAISDSVSQKIVESQEDKDFDIVIDEEGLAKITECVSGEIKEQYNQRFDKIEEQTAEIRELYNQRFDKIEEQTAEIREQYNQRFDKVEEQTAEIREQSNQRFDKVDSDIDEIKALLASGAVVASELAPAEAEESDDETVEELVTVSDIVEEESAEEGEETDVIDEIVEDIDETPADGEIMPDGIPGISNGVDFSNMMKYNRSFIARIIQSSDDLKDYYGRVKNALLSYKKVNSNIAWGAERFNKGRETIARFKIRGKTLCLYLALDPNEYATSVYHQADVSDNKSMKGTPMMVKIKSPLGAKKAIRLIDEMLAKRDGVKRNTAERDYAAMYPYETMEELIEEGLVKDVSKK